MSEEEIIEYFKEVISWHRKNTPDRVYALNNKDIEMIQGLLDLYNKEKEKNKEFKKQLNTIKDIYYNTNDLEELSDVLGVLLSNLKED